MPSYYYQCLLTAIDAFYMFQSDIFMALLKGPQSADVWQSAGRFAWGNSHESEYWSNDVCRRLPDTLQVRRSSFFFLGSILKHLFIYHHHQQQQQHSYC